MAKTPACYDLIRTMSKAEKIHFRKMISSDEKSGDDLVYIQLFDLLDKMKSGFDPSKIEKQFGSLPFYKHLATSYNYLYNLLLKSITNYQITKDEKLNAFSKIQEITVLYKKGLNKQATKKVNALKKKLTGKDWYLIKYLILSAEYNLNAEFVEEKHLAKGRMIAEEALSMLKMEQVYSSLIAINNEMFQLSNELPRVENDEKIIEFIKYYADLLNAYEKRLKNSSLRFRVYYYMTKSHLLDLNNDFIQLYFSSLTLLNSCIQEYYPGLINPINLSVAYTEHLSSIKFMYDGKALNKTLVRIKKYHSTVTEASTSFKLLCHFFKLCAHLYDGDLKKAEKELELYQNFVYKEKDGKYIHQRAAVNLISIYCMLFSGNEKMFDQLLNENYELSKHSDTNFQEIELRIIEIISHLNNGNFSLCYHLTASLKRTLELERKKKKVYTTEYEWVKFIHKVSTYEDKTELKKLLPFIEFTYDFIPDRKFHLDTELLIHAWVKSTEESITLYEAWLSLIADFRKYYQFDKKIIEVKSIAEVIPAS